MSRIYIRVISLLLAIALCTIAFGRELLLDFCEKGDASRRNLHANERIGDSAFAEEQENKLCNCKTAIKSSDLAKIPFLVKGIKYKCIKSNETIVFESSNQFFEYDVTISALVYYSYRCSIREPRLGLEECESIAKKAVYDVFSQFKKFIITDIILCSDDEKVCSFLVSTTLTKDKMIEISLRKDTGSVVLYDAVSCVDALKTALRMK